MGKGTFAYHAVPGNHAALSVFRTAVIVLWRRTLGRRSQKDVLSWQRITRLAPLWLPKARVLHPWPSPRFTVRYPRQEPYAENPLVRIYAQGTG